MYILWAIKTLTKKNISYNWKLIKIVNIFGTYFVLYDIYFIFKVKSSIAKFKLVYIKYIINI